MQVLLILVEVFFKKDLSLYFFLNFRVLYITLLNELLNFRFTTHDTMGDKIYGHFGSKCIDLHLSSNYNILSSQFNEP